MSKYSKVAEPLDCGWIASNSSACGLSFSNMNSFTSHVKDHIVGSDGPKMCQWIGCDFSCSDSQNFAGHVLYHPYHSYQKLLGAEYQRRHKLPSCQIDGDTKNLIPAVEIELKCLWNDGECGKLFQSVGEFYQHTHEHIMTDGKMECLWKGCMFQGRDKSKVHEHARSHLHEKVVACPTCGSLFASNAKFKDHLTRQVEPTDPSLSCSFCQKCYPNERLLREHIRRHINTFKCPHCELTCNSPSRLLHHIRFRHMENKPHECPVCQKKFKTPYALSDHIESHQQRRYTCSVTGCRYTAKTLKSWQHHMKTAHMPDLMLYCCHVCNLRYSSGQKLTSHLKETHGFELPPGHCRFRYIAGPDGLKRLQTVRLDDDNIVTPEIGTFSATSVVQDDQDQED